MKKFVIFTALSLSLFVCSGIQKESLDVRIQRVENGLINPVIIKGQPEKMSLSDRMEHYKVPGISIAVINDYKIEWAKGYGLKEAKGTEPVTPSTRFQAASISKPVAATASLHFVEKGLLGLDENVNDKLVSWKVPENKFTKEKKVTLRRLLSHSAGLTVHGFGGYAQGKDVPTLQQILDGEKPANSKPIRVDIIPDRARYSGGGYTVMQQLLIDIQNKPFPEIMYETVLSPLGMKDSTYEQPLPESLRDDAAAGHSNNGKPIRGKRHTYPEMAAAGLWTTPSDLCRFAIELMLSRVGKSNKVLSQDMTNQMLTPIQGHDSIGLGIVLRGEKKDFSFSHGGSNAGFQCYLIAYPEKGQGAVVMTNGNRGSPLYTEILRSLTAEYGWSDFQPKEKVLAEVDPAVFDRYVGKYQFEKGTLSDQMMIVVTVTKKEKGLLLRAPIPGMPMEIYPESDSEFFATTMDIQITFVIDKEGKVTEMIPTVRGQTEKGKKIE